MKDYFKIKSGPSFELTDSKMKGLKNIVQITYPSEIEAQSAFNQMQESFRVMKQLI